MAWFIDLEVAAGEGLDEEVALRFKGTGEARRVSRVWLDEGGWVQVFAVGEPAIEPPEGVAPGAGVLAIPVEDSSDGTALLLAGGALGLRLVAEATGRERREPYLLLALRTPTE